MKSIQFVVFFANLVLSLILSGVTTPLAAQSQEGSVAIASAIKPPAEVAFENCVVTLMEKVKVTSKEAITACSKDSDRKAKTARRIANEAADATKASRPMLIESSCCGYGYGGYRSYGFQSYGYGSSDGFYNQPMYREIRRREVSERDPSPPREVPRREPPPAREVPSR